MYGNGSQFLQALGWATLNSFWQMALLWVVYLGAVRLFRLSATNRYRAAVSALLLGFSWCLVTGVLYYQNQSSSYALFANTVSHADGLLTACLFSASITYLLLLLFPAMRLLRNWRFVQAIKREGLSKADLHARLFVQNIAAHLGIRKKVKLVVSSLVNSPVTVGYLKPIILLPVAAMNNLSTAQVEAILLHELSHIRRYDYLLNLIVSFIHTLLYFNPFVKNFVTAVENERETCCDEVVLQFGYDKVGYASALLQLEKTSAQHKALALAAAGQQNLLTRIEKIVGMEKKKTFRLVQIIPLLTALFCILLFNSVLIIQDAKLNKAMAFTNDAVFMPWQFEQSERKAKLPQAHPSAQPVRQASQTAATTEVHIDIFNDQAPEPAEEPTAATSSLVNAIIPVNFDDVDGRLTNEEKQEVKSTLEATKKVASALQWKQISASLADVMNEKEKAQTHQHYLQEFEKIDWKRVEQNLKANYDNVNWQAVQADVSKGLAQVQRDSLQNIYAMALTELQKMEKEVSRVSKLKHTAVPDCSIEQLKAAQQTLRSHLDSLKACRTKKIIQL